jgi:hypothetical protein
MHYLKLALLAEGPSDHRFLPLVLRRLTIDLCGRQAPRFVEIEDEVVEVTLRSFSEQDIQSFNILFTHADGAGNPPAARARALRPLADWMARREPAHQSRSVPVIPVREMEAWALVDGEALRNAFGSILEDEDLELPSKPREVESIFDPKRALDEVFGRALGGRRRKRARAVNFLSAIGERVRLERLRQVPAFQELESDLQQALDELGYFR